MSDLFLVTVRVLKPFFICIMNYTISKKKYTYKQYTFITYKQYIFCITICKYIRVLWNTLQAWGCCMYPVSSCMYLESNCVSCIKLCILYQAVCILNPETKPNLAKSIIYIAISCWPKFTFWSHITLCCNLSRIF